MPQGSVLGPLLFNLFINDIADFFSNSTKIKMFADDLKLYTELSTDLNSQFQIHLDHISFWATTWQLGLFDINEYTFESFKPLTQDQILFLIRRAPDKTSELDPIPTWLVRECADILAPFFAHVFNASLLEGYLPADQKRAIIYPGLKKPSLDPDDIASYRPISNLSFTSKLLERAVHAQLLISI